MSRSLKCTVCGQPYLAKSPRAKYCPNCREKANMAVKLAGDRRRREERRPDPLDKPPEFCDTPENIQTCLNCKQKDCPGFCIAVARGKSDRK